MINKPIDDIDVKDIQDLIENGVMEGKTIEYKQDLTLITDNDKKEFLYDVSSFANASGGDLIFGITENRTTGLPEAIKGVLVSNLDEEQRKIESLIRDSIQPRLAGVEIRYFNVSDGRIVLLIRIAKGWNAPHQVTFKGADKFYTRAANGKYKLDVFELRNAFLLSETVAERIRKFREEKIAQILSGETTVPLKPHGKILLQLVPLTAFTSSTKYDFRQIKEYTTRLPPLGGGSRDWTYNLDGMLSYVPSPGMPTNDSYIQLYWNGIIETVNSDIFRPYESKLLIPAVSGLNYEKQIIDVCKEYLNYLEILRVDLPILVMLTLIDVKGYRIEYGSHLRFFNKEKAIDRTVLILPEFRIDSYKVNIEGAFKETFDMVWNASGLERSYNYSDDGSWNPKR